MFLRKGINTCNEQGKDPEMSQTSRNTLKAGDTFTNSEDSVQCDVKYETNTCIDNNYEARRSDDSKMRQKFQMNCELCYKKFNSAKNYDLHLKSLRHLQKANPVVYYRCMVCKKQYPGLGTYSIHLTGKYHKKRIMEEKLHQKLKINDGIDGHLFEYRCHICVKKFTSLVTYDIHLKSPKHYNCIRKCVIGKKDYCQVCAKIFTGHKAFQAHRS